MKETLEEASEKCFNYIDHRNTFIAGAKWMQERSYSEEEVKQAYTEGGFAQLRYIDGLPYIDRDRWFEQFKKK